MDILVPVICSDKTIEVQLTKLLKYSYFENILENEPTKVNFKKNPTVDINGNRFVIYTTSVPYITVECSSFVLLVLLDSIEYHIYPNEYTDVLIDIMKYNSMYGTGVKLVNSTWGLNINKYFGMIIFIKQKLPTVNAYNFLINSGFWAPDTFIAHSFKLCAQNKLDPILIEDLLSYLKSYLLRNKINCFDYNDLILDVLNTIVNCCVDYKHVIEKQIDNELIKKMLHNFVKNNEYDCNKSMYLYDKKQNIIKYNDKLEKIFGILQKLTDANIIDLNNVGTIQEFQVY